MEYSYRNPRTGINQAINDQNLAWCLNKTAEIHGPFCPGSALGVMASVCGLRQLDNGRVQSDRPENLMAIVEINASFADGVQVVYGCTLGNMESSPRERILEDRLRPRNRQVGLAVASPFVLGVCKQERVLLSPYTDPTRKGGAL